MRRLLLLLLAAVLLGAEEADHLGFSLDAASVPADEIRVAAKKRDPVPVVDEPGFVPAAEASWVADSTPVIGVSVGSNARAYPVHLMEYHQLVNDTLGGVPLAVCFDPLTGTPRALDRRVGGRTLTLSVSGLVYNSGLLLYDRETETLWSQFTGEAVAGKLAGKRLDSLPVRQERLSTWLGRHSGSGVLERPMPKRIDYRYSPFKAYWLEDKIPFPVRAEDPRFHAKEVVLGVEAGGKTRAYLGSLVSAAGHHVEDEVDGLRVVVDYDPEEAVFVWQAPDGVRVSDSYWFAWKAFHPDTEIWNEPRASTAP